MENVNTETPHKLAQIAKCAHAGCLCTVEAGERYCSDYCAVQANASGAADDTECSCGHPECAAASSHSIPPLGRETV
jgi:hypothetical protein